VTRGDADNVNGLLERILGRKAKRLEDTLRELLLSDDVSGGWARERS